MTEDGVDYGIWVQVQTYHLAEFGSSFQVVEDAS